jgi:hypothetical protein
MRWMVVVVMLAGCTEQRDRGGGSTSSASTRSIADDCSTAARALRAKLLHCDLGDTPTDELCNAGGPPVENIRAMEAMSCTEITRMLTKDLCTVGGTTGRCIEKSSCSGTAHPGYCPGAANIQCCIEAQAIEPPRRSQRQAIEPPTRSQPEEATAEPQRSCCRVCTKGCPCGDSCISCSKTCRKGRGCAC